MFQITPVTGVLIIIGAWVAIAILAACNLISLPPPPGWFDQWSKLIATVAVAAIGARVLWSAPKQLQAFLDRTK
jgi:hypothetical protein